MLKGLRTLPFVGLIIVLAKFAVKILAGVIMLGIIYSFATKDFSAITYVLSPNGPVIKLYQSLYDKLPEIYNAVKNVINKA